MNLEQFLAAAVVFRDLGDAVGNQLSAAASGEAVEDQNVNAMRACRSLLRLLVRREVDGAADLLAEIDSLLEAA